MKIDDVLKKRGNRYGSFEDNSRTAQQIKHALIHSRKGIIRRYGYITQEALDMIASKLSRIATGDPDYEDNWVDIIGYSQLVLDYIKENKEPELYGKNAVDRHKDYTIVHQND